MKILLVIFLISVVCFSSCKRYEDGPLISIRTVEKRLYKRWRLDGTNVNDTIWMHKYVGSTWEFTNDTLVVEDYFSQTHASQLSGDKESLIVKMSVGSTLSGFDILDSVIFDIKLLSHKHLTLESTNTPEPYKFLFTKAKH